jgi:hypothetical protein
MDNFPQDDGGSWKNQPGRIWGAQPLASFFSPQKVQFFTTFLQFKNRCKKVVKNGYIDLVSINTIQYKSTLYQ